nr:hypothetical protein [Tanacetum cinerariifolium]
MQTQTSNTLHNAIMEAGSKDRPPMLAPGNYVQWKSKIKRYIDTKPNHELIHYCLENPPYELGQNAGNLNGYNEVQNVGNQFAQNPRVQNVGNQNGLIGVQGNGIQNQIGNGNLVAARAEGNAAGQNTNQIRHSY